MPVPKALAPPGPGPRRRTRRLLARLRRPRPVPVRLSRRAQVRALVEVLDEAVAVQRLADPVVAACGEPGPVSGQAAQDCGRAGSAIHRLRARLRELPLTEADLVDFQERAGRLLAYDQWMVRQSLNIAFTVHPDARTETARLQINGLGRPADDLRRLRDAVSAEPAGEPAGGPEPDVLGPAEPGLGGAEERVRQGARSSRSARSADRDREGRPEDDSGDDQQAE
ncbi:hypothetical protein ACF1AX_26835 [Streptomyces sp. NPDC014802]|uniref:hypothetical protein n=1 Tax=unclassified Streptomyces TaxID=2593676 RepID=UPI003702B025